MDNLACEVQPPPSTANLACTAQLHPFNDGRLPSDIQVKAHVDRSGSLLVLTYFLLGNIQSVVLPARAPKPERQDGLWQHTCFEAFISWGDNLFYWELNAAPSGDWNLFHFEGYRSGQSVEEKVSSVDSRVVDLEGDVFEYEVHLDLAQFVGQDCVPEEVSLGLTAVIEQVDGHVSYWALEHLSDHPDFHVRGSFLLGCSSDGSCKRV